MKKIVINTLCYAFFALITTTMVSQDIPKYEYLEIIVVQKANNSGRLKRIKVQEQKSLEGKRITIKEIEDLEETSDLLNYMNNANWEAIRSFRRK